MPFSQKHIPTVCLVVALVVAMVAACGDGEALHEPGQPPGRGVYVPASWQETRQVSGHRVHVLDERVACNRCHAMTGSSMGDVVPSKCAECHQKESGIQHATRQAQARFGEDAKTDCTSCHGFSLDGTGHAAEGAMARDVPAATECRRCHADAQGETPAVQVHGTSDCVTCHRPHDDEHPKPGPCEGCHSEVHTGHASDGRSVIETCTTCHQHQHAPASDALGTCTGCHATHEPKVDHATALFEDGHTQCVGCHRPHAFEKSAAVPCRSCHEDVHVLGGRRVAAHERCESCHAPHDVRGTPEHACATCHGTVHPDHPKREGAGTCVGCHDPHPTGQQRDGAARSCSACHQVAASDHAFHERVPCTECHTPHHFALQDGDRAACQRCHGREVSLAATLAGHASCEGCHRGLPHHPARRGVACAECHDDVQSAARPGHDACTACHEPHGGSLMKECRNCHAAEHRTAPPGHQNCTNCHEQHSGSAARAACATCHADEAASPHGQLSRDCASCHRPHGPEGIAKPPSCASCHQNASLPGLHRRPKHGECLQCHSEHGAVRAVYRSECLSCHADRKDHFPEAPTCASCHLFGPAR